MLLGRPSPFYLELTLGRFPTGQPPGRRTLIGWPGRVNARTRRQVFAISASARTSASALSPSSPTAVQLGQLMAEPGALPLGVATDLRGNGGQGDLQRQILRDYGHQLAKPVHLGDRQRGRVGAAAHEVGHFGDRTAIQHGLQPRLDPRIDHGSGRHQRHAPDDLRQGRALARRRTAKPAASGRWPRSPPARAADADGPSAGGARRISGSRARERAHATRQAAPCQPMPAARRAAAAECRGSAAGHAGGRAGRVRSRRRRWRAGGRDAPRSGREPAAVSQRATDGCSSAASNPYRRCGSSAVFGRPGASGQNWQIAEQLLAVGVDDDAVEPTRQGHGEGGLAARGAATYDDQRLDTISPEPEPRCRPSPA